MEKSQILLETVQPGEEIFYFKDALGILRDKLSYLYASESGDRYWYDTRPTLRKRVKTLVQNMEYPKIERELRELLSGLQRDSRRNRIFSQVHVWPSGSYDVPDNTNLRLVVLHPAGDWKETEKEAKDLLLHYGEKSRVFRNVLMFLATDGVKLTELTEKVREYLAWRTIERDKDNLHLDSVQIRETNANIEQTSKEVDALIAAVKEGIHL